MDFKKLQKEQLVITHDFFVLRIIYALSNKDLTPFVVINKMIEETALLINKEEVNKYNIIDNNLFELSNLINDLKANIEDENNGSAYLLLMNSSIDYLIKMNNLIDSLTKDYSLVLLNNDLNNYFVKISSDYILILKAIIQVINDYDYLIVINKLEQLLSVEMEKNEMNYLYKETRRIKRYLVERNLATKDLNDKADLFELAFISQMVK